VANPDRLPGKLGRIPRDPSRPVLYFEDYAARQLAALPVVPYTQDVDYATLVRDWPMYSNGPDPDNAIVCPGSPEGCGDCAWAYWGHSVQSWTAYNSTQVVIPDANIVGAYADCTGYNPLTGANDGGTVLQDALEYMRQTGIADSAGKIHKVAGYALLRNPSSQAGLAQALLIGGSLYCGANLQEAQEDQFSAGEPWDYVPGSPVIGGHAFALQQRAGTGLAKLREVTWGELQPATTSFHTNCVDEVYYVVTEDDIAVNGLSRAGFSLEQLLEDMAAVS
jgi:hypothetical protein